MVLAIIALMLPVVFGFLCKLLKLFSESDTAVLRKFVIKVSVPFIIFKNLYTSNLDTIHQIGPAVAGLFIMTAICTFLAYFLSKYVHNDARIQNAFAFSIMVANYGYLGWGVMELFYGESGLTRAVFFTLLFWPVFLLFGFSLIYFRNKHKGADSSVFLKTLASNAILPVIAAGLGLFANFYGVILPDILKTFIFNFASFTIPMILFTIGLMFNLRLKREALCVVMYGSLFRLIFAFLVGVITVLIVSLFSNPDMTTKKVILLESVMPPATMVPFFADFIDTDKEIMSGIITIATIISMVTIPLFYLLIESYF